MKRIRSFSGWVVAAFVAGGSIGGTLALDPPEYVQKILNDAKFHAVKIPDQVDVLINLAWPPEADADPQVQSAARRDLVGYGRYVLPQLRRAIPDLDPLYQGDAIAAFIEARYRDPSGMPPDFLPGLEEAIWYGSPEAQRIALNEIQRYNFPPAVLSSIDAAYAHPILARYVAISLGRMRDRRATLFLKDLLLEGGDFFKPAAASALERFGDRTVDDLRAGARSDDAATRQSALRVLLPLTEVSDLEMLRHYLATRNDDDPDVLEAVRRRVEVLERRATP